MGQDWMALRTCYSLDDLCGQCRTYLYISRLKSMGQDWMALRTCYSLDDLCGQYRTYLYISRLKSMGQDWMALRTCFCILGTSIPHRSVLNMPSGHLNRLTSWETFLQQRKMGSHIRYIKHELWTRLPVKAYRYSRYTKRVLLF